MNSFSIIDFIFPEDNKIAIAINFVIFALFFLLLLRISFQFYWISRAKQKLKKLNEYLSKLNPSDLSTERIERLVLEKEYKHPWIIERLSIVKKLREDTNATVESINSINQEQRWKVYGILKYPTGSLIVLGLFGTVLGLQKAVQSLLPTMTNALDLESVKLVMVGTLGGMQTAFSTTLAGLFCSVIIGFLISLWLRTYLGNYLIEVKVFFIDTVIPLYSILGTGHISGLVDHTKSLRESVHALETQSSVIFQPLIESTRQIKLGNDKIFMAAQTFIKGSENFEKLSNTLDKNFMNLVDQIIAMNKSIDAYSNYQSKIDIALESINKTPEYFELLLTNLTKEFNHHQQAVQVQQSNVLEKSVVGLQSSIDSLSTQVNEWKDKSSNAEEILEESASKNMAKLSVEFEKILKNVSDTSVELSGVSEKASTMMDNFKELPTDISRQYLKANENQYELVQESFKEVLTEMKEEQRNLNAQVMHAISSWIEVNKNLTKGLDALPGRIAKSAAH